MLYALGANADIVFHWIPNPSVLKRNSNKPTDQQTVVPSSIINIISVSVISQRSTAISLWIANGFGYCTKVGTPCLWNKSADNNKPVFWMLHHYFYVYFFSLFRFAFVFYSVNLLSPFILLILYKLKDFSVSFDVPASSLFSLSHVRSHSANA